MCLARYLPLHQYDDSGDPGFKLGRGSTDYFAIATVFFDDDLDAEEMALKTKRKQGEESFESVEKRGAY